MNTNGVALAELKTPNEIVLIQERRSRSRVDAPPPAVAPRSYSGSPQMMSLGGLIIIGVLVGSYTTNYDVVIGHANGALAVPTVGFLALQLFLARAALRLYDDVRSCPTLIDFVMSQLFRYLPAVVPAVLFGFVLINTVTIPGIHAPLANVPANLFMLADFVGIPDIDSSHWRLKIEIIQSVLVAAAWFGPARRNLVCLLAVSLAINAFEIAGEPVRHNVFSLHGVLTNDGYLPLFVFGVALYQLTLDRASKVWCAMLAASAVLAFLSNTPIHGACVVVALTALSAIAMGGLQWLGRWRWLAHLGEIAFPIYVVHYVLGFAIIHRLEPLGCSPLVAILAASAVSIAAGKLLNAAVERPIQRHSVAIAAIVNRTIGHAARRAKAVQFARSGRPVPAEACLTRTA